VTDVGVNESSDPMLLLRRYERQIKELKQELAMRDALSGRGRISYDDMSDAEIRELNALAKKFLSGNADVEELPCETVKSIREAYKQV
jgi:kinesin family protein 6/9